VKTVTTIDDTPMINHMGGDDAHHRVIIQAQKKG
jgi:hypothetical protein